MAGADAKPAYSKLLVSGRSGWLTRQRRARIDLALQAAQLDTRRAECVLDLGCADGVLWPDIEGRVGKIVGLNYDEWLTKQCKSRFPAGILLRGNAMQLPLADNSFDLCFCLEMFNYPERHERPVALREIARVLKPGGRLVLTSAIEVGLPGLIKFAGRVVTRGCWPNVAAHRDMLWRRVFYKWVDLHEERRKTSFHYNVHELVDHLREYMHMVRVQAIPFFYPFVTTLLIVADKPA